MIKTISSIALSFAAAIATCNAQTGLHVIGTVSAGGYTFTNFDGPNAGTNAGAGTNMNGISNMGSAVGFTISNGGTFDNFIAELPSTAVPQNPDGSTTANAFGVNSFNDVVGTDGNGNAFLMHKRTLVTFIPMGGSSAVAFGINDRGGIVGQYTTGNVMPGFFVPFAKSQKGIRIDAPSGPDTVNAQGINDQRQVVGFYVGSDGQDHGFMANLREAKNGQITGTPIADPTIPAVAGEPGATFVFSQVLAINDAGIAVGYYGDSTTSQHGFIYNTNNGQYTFLDDPAEAFNNGVEVTQITGINNSNEITGFYTDANGVAHGFIAKLAE